MTTVKRYSLLLVPMLAALAAVWLIASSSVSACGGFFCTTSPVDQNAERIIFTQNGDGTVSAYVQIEYTGEAPDFSWILPLPEAIAAGDVEVPEDAMAAFTELEVSTDPVFLMPSLPECVQNRVVAVAAMSMSSVEVFATGEVGPYGFDVVGSEDPDALISWLRDNNYRVTEAMEPLIDLYVVEGFVFLAMRLRPDAGVQEVEPVKVTYPSEAPMIPLRLTAVAANPDMAVMVWVYAQEQAVPANYVHETIANDELVFFGSGQRSNYRTLIGQKANEHGGQAFITEFAGPTSLLRVAHPLLQDLGRQHPYLTRLNTVISPDEMTVDPVFRYDGSLPDVSNVRDLSEMTGVFDCEPRASQASFASVSSEAAGGPSDNNGGPTEVSSEAAGGPSDSNGGPTEVSSEAAGGPSDSNGGPTEVSSEAAEDPSDSNEVLSRDNNRVFLFLLAGVALLLVGVIAFRFRRAP